MNKKREKGVKNACEKLREKRELAVKMPDSRSLPSANFKRERKFWRGQKFRLVALSELNSYAKRLIRVVFRLKKHLRPTSESEWIPSVYGGVGRN